MEKTLASSNEAAAKKANSFFIQPKLTINQPNDVYEQEADAMADKVMRIIIVNNYKILNCQLCQM